MRINLFLFCVIGGFLLLSSCEKNESYQEDLQLELNSTAPVLPQTTTPTVSRNDVCIGLFTWTSNQIYQLGDRVIWQGNAFEKINYSATGWRYLGACQETAPTVSICDGVPQWVSGQTYQLGDRVIWQENVFQRIEGDQWEHLGGC